MPQVPSCKTGKVLSSWEVLCQSGVKVSSVGAELRSCGGGIHSNMSLESC